LVVLLVEKLVGEKAVHLVVWMVGKLVAELVVLMAGSSAGWLAVKWFDWWALDSRLHTDPRSSSGRDKGRKSSCLPWHMCQQCSQCTQLLCQSQTANTPNHMCKMLIQWLTSCELDKQCKKRSEPMPSMCLRHNLSRKQQMFQNIFQRDKLNMKNLQHLSIFLQSK
jgi:hypothetical protein